MLITGYGKTYLVNTGNTKLSVHPLTIKVPINSETYLDQSKSPTKFFRVTDILLEKSYAPVRKFYVAHHYLDTENQCYNLSLSETTIDLRYPKPEPWVTRYSAKPCTIVSVFRNTTGCHLAFMQDGNILITISNHSYSKGISEYVGNWTPERLDRFIANPAKKTPGTKMEFPGVKDPKKRKELIQLFSGHLNYKVDERR